MDKKVHYAVTSGYYSIILAFCRPYASVKAAETQQWEQLTYTVQL